MGFLRGLLEPYIHNNTCSKEGQGFPFSVAIVERGPKDYYSNSQQRDLSRWFEAAHQDCSSSVSILSAMVSGRQMSIPVGRGVGGGSNINAGLCMAPPLSDWKDWPEPWRTDLPVSVRKLQQHLAKNGCLCDAATGRPISVQDLSSPGTPTTPCLARQTIGNNDNSRMINSVERVNYYQGLLEPLLLLLQGNAKQSTPFHWYYNTEAQRLLFDAETTCNRVSGIEVMKVPDGSYTRLSARKEVILCAGAIETPALLLVSGIGTGSISNKSSHHLRDHVILPRVMLGPPPFWNSTINGIHSIQSTIVETNKFLILTSTTKPEIALHYMTRVFQKYWFSMLASGELSQRLWHILEQLLRLLVLYSPVYWIMMYGFTTINLALVNPASKGSLCLKPKTGELLLYNVPPCRKDFDVHIEPGYLTQSTDVEALWKGWVASNFVLDRHQGWEVYPGRIFRFLQSWLGTTEIPTRSQTTVPTWFSQYAHDHCLPFFHWCGSCAMKPPSDAADTTGSRGNNTWVVDADMKVRGVQSLRICDASVLPNNLSVPPALTCAAMGHRLASTMHGRTQ
ncbi:Uncharacterized GMC-type oxidoreductase [Seminavis robusta]|uniref:Uncharacterized GMC-type oxidoreductase n=1 Tax=Seminavis robusta TaxID=568900 RepID=A0A9N8E036_9STRA|nr:Uncharacterized GMC-type oxidoreductase [Seminavis robusta]|eukprot:Sro486_g152690.1 Uncharacterized GMC-type oxidoreductase (565) ;mRNA; f:47079-48773